MTHTLDVGERITHLEPARRAAAATQTAARSDRLKTFAITFGIAYVILYTFFERWNVPLFTYHPAVDRWDLFKNAGVPEDGPPHVLVRLGRAGHDLRDRAGRDRHAHVYRLAAAGDDFLLRARRALADFLCARPLH